MERRIENQFIIYPFHFSLKVIITAVAFQQNHPTRLSDCSYGSDWTVFRPGYFTVAGPPATAIILDFANIQIKQENLCSCKMQRTIDEHNLEKLY